MSLKEYRQKRNFDDSPEPSTSSEKHSGKSPIFVVQKHDASHLHYDFRLESDGGSKELGSTQGPVDEPC